MMADVELIMAQVQFQLVCIHSLSTFRSKKSNEADEGSGPRDSQGASGGAGVV